MKSKYSTYLPEDFAQDASFIEYIRKGKPEAETFWTEFARFHPEKKRELDLAEQMIKALTVQEPSWPVENREQILIKLREYENGMRKKIPVSLLFDVSWMKVAAVLIGFILLGSYFFLHSGWGNVEFSTNFGEVQKIILPDQSEVMLNGNSKIHYARKWKDNEPREVWIEGEAFFDIKKLGDKPNRRFLVHTPDLVVEVLGTRFNVLSRGENTTITLNSGQILINLENQEIEKSLLMKPGEMVTYSKQNKTLVRKEVRVDDFSSWTLGRLIFDNSTLLEIARKIEATYGVKVKFDNKELVQRKMRGAAPTDNLEILLVTIEKVFDLKVTRIGNEIHLDRR